MPSRPFQFAALILAAGLLGYTLTRQIVPPPAPAEAASPEAQIEWLAREFELTPGQASEIARLQAAYAPICAEHCSAIIRARETLGSSGLSPEARAAAAAELARLERVCAGATRAHLQAVASVMPPGQGTRFLTLMEPRVAHTGDRTGAPSLAR